MILARRVAGALASVCAAIFIVTFLILPTRTAEILLGSAASTVYEFSDFVLFASVLGIVAGLLLYRLARLDRVHDLLPIQESGESPVALSSRTVLFLALAGALLLSRTLWQIYGPLDWDEIERAAVLASGRTFSVVNPLTTLNHPIATLASAVSAKIFGMNKIALRLPAIGFALLWVLVLFQVSRLRLSKFTSVLLWTHLLSNALVVWYLHSMRGYVSMMLVTSVLYFGALRFTETANNRLVSWKQFLGFGILFSSSLLTHGFGGIFCFIFILSALVWLSLHRRELSAAKAGQGLKFVFLGGGILAAASLLFIFHLRTLTNTGFILTEESGLDLSYKLTRLTMVFGVARLWYGKLVLMVAGILMGVGLLGKFYFTDLIKPARLVARRSDFPLIFLLTAAVFIGGNFWFLKVEILEGRMLLAFLVPFLVWVGESIHELPLGKAREMVMGIVVFIFCIPQLANGPSLLHGDLSHFAGHEEFADKVKTLTDQTPVECFSFSGEPSGINYARHFYFLDAKARLAGCPRRFHLHYGEDQFGKKYDLPAMKSLLSIYEDGHGRALFQAMNQEATGITP